MNALIKLALISLLSVSLVLPALAEKNEKVQPAPPAQAPAQTVEQRQAEEVAGDPHQSEAFKRQQEYFQKREAMRQRRDEALKIREQNVNQ